MAACSDELTGAFPRISARAGQVVDLDVSLYRNGVLSDPYAIRYVEIYRTQVLPHNLVTTIPFVDPDDPLYPAPACQPADPDAVTGGTEESVLAGKYHLPYSIPADSATPDVYFDVWYYYATDPCLTITSDTSGTGSTDLTACDLDSEEATAQLISCCHRFWVYPDGWFCADGLQTVRFGFEPLDIRFHYPEVRPLEVGLMPLPLYDYNFNLVNPLIPLLRPTISIETQNCELLVDNDECRIGIRQGSYRSNPWVIQYDLDTSLFLKGTYQYQIMLTLPDGSTRVSRKFILTIA